MSEELTRISVDPDDRGFLPMHQTKKYEVTVGGHPVSHAITVDKVAGVVKRYVCSGNGRVIDTDEKGNFLVEYLVGNVNFYEKD